MSAVLKHLRARGLSIRTDGFKLFVSPPGLLDADLRTAISGDRSRLIAALQSNALVEAIHRCCDHRGDSDSNRAGLIVGITDFTVTQQADLIEHFTREADLWAAIPGVITNQP